jgi:pimeloyl-ACP methyl ester carboxylesterase
MMALALAGCARDPVMRHPWVKALARAEQAQRVWSDPAKPQQDRERAAEDYEKATALFVHQLKEKLSWAGWLTLTNDGLLVGRYELFVQTPGGAPDWIHGGFDRLIPASEVKQSRTSQRWNRSGIGGELVGRQPVGDGSPGERRFLPGRGAFIPVTALLDFNEEDAEPGHASVSLRLVDPRRTAWAVYGTNAYQVAGNYAAAQALSLGNREYARAGLLGLFWPGAHLGSSGLFFLEPYDPEKIPLVLVHGLFSSPTTWEAVATALSADPALHARYQVWYFLYPTGLQIPATSSRLRDSLNEVRRALNATGNNSNLNEIVLVGHSMGGLLSRMQVIDSSETFWTNYFSKPLENMILNPGSRTNLQHAFFFEHQPFVERVVFVAVPHRGSEVADWWPARLLVRLIRLPAATLVTLKDMMTFNVDALRPDLIKYRTLGSTSLENLSPKHPFFRALDQRPILVPYHSIVADRGKGPLAVSSDGVVPYWSSHLEGARSETNVSAWHTCTTNPETVREILRILREHAGIQPLAGDAQNSGGPR